MRFVKGTAREDRDGSREGEKENRRIARVRDSKICLDYNSARETFYTFFDVRSII